MNRLMVPPLPAASRPSNRIDHALAGLLDPRLHLEQLDLEQPLVPLVLRPGHALVVRVTLAPRVQDPAVRPQQQRVVEVLGVGQQAVAAQVGVRRAGDLGPDRHG